MNNYICYRCDEEYKAYDFGVLCPECEELIDSLDCGGCDFLRGDGFDYTECDLRECSKYKLSYSDIEFCKKYKVSKR